jgi:hypothetical protein
VDLSLRSNTKFDDNIFDIAHPDSSSIMYDMSLWENIRDMYWDQIVNRWCELRKSVLEIGYIKAVYHALTDSISSSDFEKENAKWGTSLAKGNADALLDTIEKRLEWLDMNYFIV